ncbi:MAG: hypothetical protein JXA25_15675 [Anaerolineales bacterium]|nr:hypothetical protein [Anaerolineales bacterium]
MGRNQDSRADGNNNNPAIVSALEQLERARQRMISAAIAFCDGSISAGQLRAVRELLREQEQNLNQLEGKTTPPFKDEPDPAPPILNPDVVPARSVESKESEPPEPEINLPESFNTELREMLLTLEQKLQRLEQDFQQGIVNPAQYRAIRKHYIEQKSVATRMGKLHPENELWRVVLEEGKTTFLMQLNEAQVFGIAFYDIVSKNRLFHEGTIPVEAQQAITILQTFGIKPGSSDQGRMFATQTDDGKVMLLIPGTLTVAIVIFSQEPPNWQVRALREVHHNFENANKVSLEQNRTGSLIFPDLSRFFRSTEND